MDRVGIVTAEHKAARAHTAVIFFVHPQSENNPPENVLQEGGSGALFRTGAHLLIIKAAVKPDTASCPAPEKSLQSSVCALQVIQPPGGEKLPVRAPDRGLHAVVKIQIHPEKILRTDSGFRRGHFPEAAAFYRRASQKGKQIGLQVQGHAFIDLPVHMNGKIRYQDQIPVKVDQPGLVDLPAALYGLHFLCLTRILYFALFADQDAPRYGKRTVHPAGTDHAAVAFRVQLQIVVPHRDFSLFLDFKCRRITVGGCHEKACLPVILPDPEGDHAGSVPHNEISPAFFKLPAAAFLQFLKACCLKFPSDRIRRVKRRRTFLQKFLQPGQFFCFCINPCCLCHNRSSFAKAAGISL